ncbi:pollen Ole e I family allergen protein [Wolffia australiana]
MRMLLAVVGLLLLARGRDCAASDLDGAEATWHAETRAGFLYTRDRERCTPGFWSARGDAWPVMVPRGASVWKVFGSPALERYEPDLTMLEAMESDDDAAGGSAFSELVKQSSAALLNSYARDGFPYTPWEVKTLLLLALVSEQAAQSQAQTFADSNRLCG